uniref:Uncharacterized protein n=1 Tax=Oryza brachyantha TaxID=4533 RepID=J3N4N2_ORYBR
MLQILDDYTEIRPVLWIFFLKKALLQVYSAKAYLLGAVFREARVDPTVAVLPASAGSRSRGAGPTAGTRRGGSSGAVLELDDEPADGLAHLLEADGADGLDAGGSQRRGRGIRGGGGGGGAGGLIHEALGADPLANRLDELLGVVAGDAEELPPLLERLERGVRGRRLLSPGLPARLHHGRRRRHELLVRLAQLLHRRLHLAAGFLPTRSAAGPIPTRFDLDWTRTTSGIPGLPTNPTGKWAASLVRYLGLALTRMRSSQRLVYPILYPKNRG